MRMWHVEVFPDLDSDEGWHIYHRASDATTAIEMAVVAWERRFGENRSQITHISVYNEGPPKGWLNDERVAA